MKGERATGTLELIHSDVYGPMSMHARGGYLYFVTFIDARSLAVSPLFSVFP